MEERQVRRIVAHRRADQAVAIEHIEIKMRVLLGVPVVRFTFGDTQMVEGKRPIYGPYVTKEKQTQIKIPVSQDREMRVELADRPNRVHADEQRIVWDGIPGDEPRYFNPRIPVRPSFSSHLYEGIAFWTFPHNRRVNGYGNEPRIFRTAQKIDATLQKLAIPSVVIIVHRQEIALGFREGPIRSGFHSEAVRIVNWSCIRAHIGKAIKQLYTKAAERARTEQ